MSLRPEMMDVGGNGSGLPVNNKQRAMIPNKSRGEFARNPRKDSEGLSESPDLEFEYADTDKWAAELSELYSYTEGPEFALNRKCFEEEFRTHVSDKKWTELDAAQHRAHAMRLLDSLEVIAREKRLKVARAILYMAQGTFAECTSETEVQHWMRYNIFLLLDVGTFSALVELLNMEIEYGLHLLSPFAGVHFLHTDMAEPFIPVTINHLCCRICNKVLRNPVTVPCGHNFCMRCIEDSWNKNASPNCQYSCPECIAVFPSKPQLIRNTTLDQLVRDTQNVSKKRKQQNLRASLQDLKRFRSCTKTGTPGIICERHNCPLDVYCCTDELIICAKCALDEHQRHQIAYVEIERKRKQVEVQNMQVKFKEILQQQEKIRNNTEKIFKQIQDEAKQTKDSCESVVVSVIDSLQEHYLSVKNLIEAQEAAAAAQVQVTLQALEAKMKEMKKKDAELDCLAQSKSDVHFLQQWPSLQVSCETDHLHQFQVLEDPLLPFELTKRDVEQLGNQLKDFCDKEFASICQTDLNCALTEQNVEPETRAQFLQYACELTLNPATAHEDLVVSEGDKEVTMRAQMTKCPSIRYPERFLHRRQVLCREGLQAERCYYEIEVEGDKVEIALAYKSIDRKTRNKMSAFGGSAKSWSLDRSKYYSVSHNSGSVQLTTSPTHPRIGIYLKFNEGTLSFFEVSDSMKFLYRVEAKFTESLYPGFWLGEKSCIRICDLRLDYP